MMTTSLLSSAYEARRGRLESYFDHTASKTWERLTSDAPVSGIRATVRAGRNRMRETLLSWLPQDLSGTRILDAGCGTGGLAVEVAQRGAEVVAIDIAGSLVQVGRDRAPRNLKIDWRVGDMLDPALGCFDHVVAMDSLIHYAAFDIADVVRVLTERTNTSLLLTFAPSTRPLVIMHAVGKLFPRADRAPAIEPVRAALLRTLIASAVPTGQLGRSARISGGFYTSQAMEVLPG